MKPIDFMDALGDVQEKYVRQMLDEDESAHESGKVGGAVLNTAFPIETVSGSESRIRRSETGRPFGGKLRYAVLLASTAACLAAVVGIMHLHQDSSENMIAESMLQELQIETGTTTATESAAKSTTAQTTASTASAAAIADAQTETVTTAGTAQTERNAAAETEMQTSVSAEKQENVKSGTTTTVVTTTTATAVTTVPATTTVFMTRVADLMTDEETGVTKCTVIYEQPYLLGDVDADGAITLLDYFLARRANYQLANESEQHILDAAAYDRANLSRTLISNDPAFSVCYSQIKYLALYRSYLGKPDLTYADYISMACEYPEMENDDYETRVQKDMKKIFRVYSDAYSSWTDENEIVSEAVPKPVRDFYNDAHYAEPYDGSENWEYHPLKLEQWSDEEFRQKMDELRAILAQ